MWALEIYSFSPRIRRLSTNFRYGRHQLSRREGRLTFLGRCSAIQPLGSLGLRESAPSLCDQLPTVDVPHPLRLFLCIAKFRVSSDLFQNSLDCWQQPAY